MPTNPKLDAIHQETATPLSAKVSLSLHPESLLPHGVPLLEHDSPLAETVYKAGRTAMKGLYSTLLDMESAVTALSVPTNIAMNSGGKVLRSEVPPERRPELHAALADSFARCARTFEANRATVSEAIATLEQ